MKGKGKMKDKNYILNIMAFIVFMIIGTLPIILSFWITNHFYGFVIVLLLSIGGFMIFRNIIIKPIMELTERSQAVLEGDLTQEVAVKAKGIIGILATTINGMTESLRNLAVKIQSDTNEIKETAGALSEVANISETTTQELAASLEQASSNTQEQNANIEELQAAFEEMSASIEEIAASTQQASAVATQAITTSEDGVNAVENVSNRLDLIADSTQLLEGIIGKLEEGSKQISEMVAMITHMSEQTNLLALNAAIEAARAGEHGRGFAVVAGEVRKLAEESGNAAQNIVKIVTDNQKDTQQAVDVISRIRNEVMGGQELATKAKEALTIIMNSTKEIDANSSQVAAAVEQQSAVIEEITKSVEFIANSAQQIAAAAQQANAAVEEQSATAGELKNSSSRLGILTKELQTLVGHFITK